MKIAKIKIEENIAEYILYMYQIEDTIRAFNFNVDQIMMHVVQPQLDNQNDLISYKKNWYLELINKMKIQGIEKQGHLGELSDIIVELSYLNNTLLTIANDKKYQNIAEKTTPFVEEFKK